MVQKTDRPQAFVRTEDPNEAIVFVWNGSGYNYDVRLERRWKRAQFLGSINSSGTGWYITDAQMQPRSRVESVFFLSPDCAARWLYAQWFHNRRRIVRASLAE